MEEYFNLSSPLNEEGVFVADGEATTVNSNVSNLPSMSEYLNSLRQQMQSIDLSNNTQNSKSYEADMNLSFPELLKQEGIDIIVTSDFRPGAKTKQGRVSHHSHKDDWGHPAAIDFRAADGDYKKLLKQIYGNERVRAWLINHGKGILEETAEHPDVRSSSGADKYRDGLLHLGPDQGALRMSREYWGLDYNLRSTQRINPSNKSSGKTGKQRLTYVKNYLMQNYGLDAIHASALAGVWFAESRLDPSIKSKRDSGTGIAQWTGPRHQKFNEFYRQVFGRQSPGIRNVGLEQQIAVAIAEYKSRKNNWKDFLERTDLQGAVDSVLRGYENGGGTLASVSDIDRIYTRNGSGSYRKLMSDRLAYAQQALK